MNENNSVPQQPQQQQPQQPQQPQPQQPQPQQPQFQQQFQQNVNPQQYQQVQYPKKSITETMGDFLPKLVVIFLIIGLVAVAYDLIFGIVEASKAYNGGFRLFLNYFIRAISHGTKYLLYTVITVGVNKIVNK